MLNEWKAQWFPFWPAPRNDSCIPLLQITIAFLESPLVLSTQMGTNLKIFTFAFFPVICGSLSRRILFREELKFSVPNRLKIQWRIWWRKWAAPFWAWLEQTITSAIKKEVAAAKSLQSCPTLCDPVESSPPGSSVPGILQARTLAWVAISFSNAWKWKVKGKSFSRVRLFTIPFTAAYQAPPSMGASRQEYAEKLPRQEGSHELRSLRTTFERNPLFITDTVFGTTFQEKYHHWSNLFIFFRASQS